MGGSHEDPGTAMFFHPIVSLGMRGEDPDNDEMLSDPETHAAYVATVGKCAGIIYMLWRDRELGVGASSASASDLAGHEELTLF